MMIPLMSAGSGGTLCLRHWRWSFAYSQTDHLRAITFSSVSLANKLCAVVTPVR